MHFSVIPNPDPARKDRYEIARAIYAETGASSLRGVEALASMIFNAARRDGCTPVDVVRNREMFCARIAPRDVSVTDCGFQMCLRVVTRMLRGAHIDACCGATRFHHDGYIPAWASSIGYIAEIDGMLFYA